MFDLLINNYMLSFDVCLNSSGEEIKLAAQEDQKKCITKAEFWRDEIVGHFARFLCEEATGIPAEKDQVCQVSR